jgi:hypothetical protein
MTLMHWAWNYKRRDRQEINESKENSRIIRNNLKPWFVHWMIMMGFLGLLLATILDFI